MKTRNKKALFIMEWGEATVRPLLRGKLPARGLEQLGFKTKVASVLYEEATHTFNGWNPGENIPTPTPKFIISRPMLKPEEGSEPEVNEHFQITNLKLTGGSNRDIIECARVHGQHFFHDIDDDYWNVPEWNPSFHHITEYLEEWVEDVNSSSGLIASTWHIKWSAEHNGIKVPVYVCNNAVNYWDFAVLDYENTPLRIAWFGVLPHRAADLEPYVEEIRWALGGRRGAVEFWHIGADFEGRRNIRDILRPFPVDIIERPWYSDVQDIIAQIDIAIIPAARVPFNDGRSNALGLQLAAAGKPFLASRTNEYQQLNDYGVPCVTDTFADPLINLIDDKDFRAYFREISRTRVIDRYAPKVVAEQYVKAFEDAIARTTD